MAFRGTLGEYIRLYANDAADMEVDICQYIERDGNWGCFYRGKLDKCKIPEWALRRQVNDIFEYKENHSFSIYLQPSE